MSDAPTVPEDAGTLPFSGDEVSAILADAKARGPETYQRYLQAVAADGYELPPEHAAALAAPPKPAAALAAPPETPRTLSAPPRPQSNDPRTPEEIEFDNSSMAPAASPLDYRIRWTAGRSDGVPPEHLHALDASLREALHEMAFSANVGGSVMEMAVDSMAKWNALDEGGRELYRRTQLAQLARVVPDAEQAVRNADAMVAMIADREFASDMSKYGLLGNAQMVVALDLQYRRLQARADMAKARGAKR